MSLTTILSIIFVIALVLPWLAPTGKKSATANTKALTIIQAISLSIFFILYFLLLSYMTGDVNPHTKTVISNIWHGTSAILLLIALFTGILRITKMYADSANRWLRCSSLIIMCITFFIFTFSLQLLSH
jgi:hypothetical protein